MFWSSMSDYKKISNHYKKCLQEHGDGHLGHDWPNRQDLLKRYNTMAELFQDKSDVSILDLGCGTGMFLDFLKNSGLIEKNLITYEGADISQDHIDIASSKFKENKFYKIDVMSESLPRNYDFIIMNGIFTVKMDLDFSSMKEFFETFIKNIWPQVNCGIAFNVMSKAVDFERDDLFHLSMDQLATFLCSNISRYFVVKNDYGLYEYTTYVFKDLRK